MKKIVITVIIGLMMGALTIAASAVQLEEGTILVATADAASGALDTAVLYQMEGRAGASTPTGAKGIAFEILYKMRYNLQHLFDGTKAILSPSSTDPEADLYILDKEENVLKKIQCKDGTSRAQINGTVEKNMNGKYSSADLIGTTEFTEAYNSKAAMKGVAKLAEDSGISTIETSRFANKALGVPPTGAELVKSTLKSSGYGALFGGLCEAATSILRGDDAATTAGNVVSGSVISGLSFALVPMAQTEFAGLLTSLGVGATATTAATTVLGFAVPVAGGIVLYLVFDELDLRSKISSCAAELGTSANELCEEVQDYFSQINAEEKVETVYQGFVEMWAEAGGNVAESVAGIPNVVIEKASSLQSVISSFFSKNIK